MTTVDEARAALLWFAWFVRKSRGTIEEVTQRALEQYPYLRWDEREAAIRAEAGALDVQRLRKHEPHGNWDSGWNAALDAVARLAGADHDDVDAAREALLEALAGNRDAPVLDRLNDFEAAVRAEYAGIVVERDAIADLERAEAKLVALREAATPVIHLAQRALLDHDGKPYFPEPNGALYQGDKQAIEHLRALAATPAENGEGRT